MRVSISRVLRVLAIGMVVSAASACGSSDKAASTPDAGSPAANPDTGPTGNTRFVGTWHPTSGTVTYTCAGQVFTDTIVSNLTWAAGVGSDLVQTSGSCVFRANVTSSTASGLPSQTCTVQSGTTTAVIAFSAYTYSLSADGLTAMESASGTATVSDSGSTLTCGYNETASYTKISQ